jgi:nucleoside-diphosphate-sugar epimerase
MTMRPRVALVTGAGGIIGPYLLPRLTTAGFVVHAVSRQPRPARPGVNWHAVDLTWSLDSLPPAPIDCAIHMAPLWLLPPTIDALAARGVTRLVAFSSTSRFSKAASADPAERDVAQRLAKAEEDVTQLCRGRIRWTIFRPTLIYGGGADKNVSSIAAFIRRFGFFPLASGANGRRQPVHADDLAKACLDVLDRPATFDRVYDLAGGTTLTYREMVEAVAHGIERSPRVLTVPSALLRATAWSARLFPGFGHVGRGMVDRMGEDLVCDSGAASRDFGYAPRPFGYPGAPPPAI